MLVNFRGSFHCQRHEVHRRVQSCGPREAASLALVVLIWQAIIQRNEQVVRVINYYSFRGRFTNFFFFSLKMKITMFRKRFEILLLNKERFVYFALLVFKTLLLSFFRLSFLVRFLP